MLSRKFLFTLLIVCVLASIAEARRGGRGNGRGGRGNGRGGSSSESWGSSSESWESKSWESKSWESSSESSEKENNDCSYAKGYYNGTVLSTKWSRDCCEDCKNSTTCFSYSVSRWGNTWKYNKCTLVGESNVFINAANDYNNDWSYYWSGLVNKTTTTTTTPAVTPTPTPTTTVAPTVVTTTQEYACFVKVGSAYTTTLLSTNSAISTPIECCNLCGATSNCVGFSLNPTCQLFSAGFGNILSNGTISGQVNR